MRTMPKIATLRPALLLLTAGLSLALGGCTVISVAGTVVSTTASVAGTVISTGAKVTGKVIEKTVDAVTGEPEAPKPVPTPTPTPTPAP